MKDFSNFIKIMKELICFFDDLIPIEQEKLDAVTNNRVSSVEECMHKEQAAVLQLRGLDQKREKELASLGMKDYSFRQILEEAPEDVSAVLKPLFDQLSDQVRMYQSISSNAKDMIEVNLHTIQKAIAGKDSAGRGTYSASGKKNDSDNLHFTSRSV